MGGCNGSCSIVLVPWVQCANIGPFCENVVPDVFVR